jgi:pentatricopeptide repeat protein
MIMISALCRCRLLEEAKQLAKEYESKYAKYDNVVILNTLLRAYCNNGDMESVMQMLKRMDETGVLPDWHTFDILIKYFIKEKLCHLAYKTIEDMNSKGHKLNEVFPLLGLKQSPFSLLHPRALPVHIISYYQYMQELCTSVMIDLGKAGFPSEAFAVYNMLRYSHRNMRKSLHENILRILVRAGLLKDAYLVIKVSHSLRACSDPSHLPLI